MILIKKASKNISFITILLIILFSSPIIASTAGITEYRSRDQLLSDFLALEASYPNLLTHQIIGSSVDGRDIIMFKIGNQQEEKLLIDGAIHGQELVTAEALYYFITWLLEQDEPTSTQIIENNQILLVPILNVDMYGSSRYNTNGVDLNRNFPYRWEYAEVDTRGSYPLSEPEAQALHNVFLDYHPEYYVSFHSGWSRVSPARSATTIEQNFQKTIYDTYSSLIENIYAQNPIVWSIEPVNYYGGFSSDDARIEGSYSFEIELSQSHTPTYSSLNYYTNHVKAIISAIFNITPQPTPTPTPEPQTYELTIKDSNKGQTSPPAGTYTYNQGETITISANPNNGYSFSYWQLDKQKNYNNPITIVINQNHQLRPMYIKQK